MKWADSLNHKYSKPPGTLRPWMLLHTLQKDVAEKPECHRHSKMTPAIIIIIIIIIIIGAHGKKRSKVFSICALN